MTDEYTGIREALGGDRVAELEAACAAMREALLVLSCYPCSGCANEAPEPHRPACILDKALSSTAGADLLAEVERLRKENARLVDDTRMVKAMVDGAWKKCEQERDAALSEVAALKGEHDALRAVCLDLHDSLGVRWGDDPYHRIGKLKESEAACGALRERIRLLEGALARVLEMAGSHTRPVPDEHPAGYGAIYRVARAAIDAQTGEPR